MNKYEKLKSAKSNCYGELIFTIGIENVKTLEELLERATPKKVIDNRCPHCLKLQMILGQNNCYDCGGALDWSDK